MMTDAICYQQHPQPRWWLGPHHFFKVNVAEKNMGNCMLQAWYLLQMRFPETNMTAPENWRSEHVPFGMAFFAGAMLTLMEGIMALYECLTQVCAERPRGLCLEVQRDSENRKWEALRKRCAELPLPSTNKKPWTMSPQCMCSCPTFGWSLYSLTSF